MKLFLSIFFLFLCLFTSAETDETDSLKTILQSSPSLTDEAKFELLMELSRVYVSKSLDSSLKFGHEALALAEKIDNKNHIAKAAKWLGTVYYWHSNPAEALDYLQQALRINKEISNVEALPACYNNLGLVYNYLGQYVDALESHLEQLKYNESLGNQRGIVSTKLNIGNVYNNMGENQEALKSYQESKDIAEQLGDANAIGKSLLNMGVANMSLKNYDQALENLMQALEIRLGTNNMGDVAKIYSNLGLVYQKEKKYEMAEDYFKLSLKLHEENEYNRGIVASLINLGSVCIDIKEYDKSWGFLQRALLLAMEIDMKTSIEKAYGYLSKWYESQGQYKTALEYTKLQAALSDSLVTKEKLFRIASLRIANYVDKKDKEILEQSISIQQYKSRQLYFLLVILSILGLAFIFYYRYRLNKRLNRVLEVKIAEALKLQKEQQQIIVHQASLTSLGELAAGIAHEIKQPLQNISLSNESLDMEFREDEPDKGYIKKTIKEIYEDIKRIKFIINEISNFSRGQLEEMREPFSVNTRIENAFSLARTKFSNRRIDVKFELDEHLPDIEGNPYKFEQVIVNFFNNAKDAIEERAEESDGEFNKWMLVKSFSDGKTIVVEVIDNGVGISEENKTNIFLPFFTTKDLGKGTGLGLSISLGIIKEMGGFIELESQPMKQTTMRVKLPVGSI